MPVIFKGKQFGELIHRIKSVMCRIGTRTATRHISVKRDPRTITAETRRAFWDRVLKGSHTSHEIAQAPCVILKRSGP